MAKRHELPNGRAFDTDAELKAYMQGQEDAAKNVTALIGDTIREAAKAHIGGDAAIYTGMISAAVAKEKADKKAAKAAKA